MAGFFRATLFNMKRPKRKKRLDPNTLQLIKQVVGGILALTLIAVLVVSVWYLSRLPSLTVQQVQVSGGETISHDLVQKLVETELEGEYLRLIPKRFSLMYPEEAIVDSVRDIDRIKDLEVKRNTWTGLQISFNEYVPDALWCNSDLSSCVFLDSNGFAFAKAPSLTGGSFLRLEKLGVEPVTNVQVFNEDPYNQVKNLVRLLENNSWFIESVVLDVVGDAYLKLTEGGELKIALSDEPERIVENLFTVLTSPEFIDIGPGEFEYIDLRFGNKVFVNEFGTEVASSAEDKLE